MIDVVLGIDTGGTYTDGVILDHQTRQVLKKVKTLTTKHDLSICILKVLDELIEPDNYMVKLVSISTTLATNAIAEGKGGKVALFLLGYDPELIHNFKFADQFGTPDFYYFQGGHDLSGNPQGPLDEIRIQEISEELNYQVDAIAISGYFSPFNNQHEIAAAEIALKSSQAPVVMGSQLSSKLNSIQRATTATLNASLLSLLAEFIQSMRKSIKERKIEAPLMVMHSDGGLMDADKVQSHPVETIHSGPAASAIGAKYLSEIDKALVIDIGGTTTDLAIIDQERLKINEGGTIVGKYNTAVRAADVCSIGLGGDSLLSLNVENRLTIGPQRVTPVAYLAQSAPQIKDYLERELPARMRKRFSRDNFEFWFIQNKPQRVITNDRSREVVNLLKNGPLALTKILDELQIFHPLQFNGQELIRQGIIGRSSITPTDLLHVTGEFSPWDVESASIVVDWFARMASIDAEDLAHRVRELMAETITCEIISFITKIPFTRLPEYAPSTALGQWLVEESLYEKNLFLGNQVFLKMPIIGIGAPAGIFLPRVAELLDTELILPEHHEVANAIGAVAGSVILTQDAWMYPQLKGMHPVGYYLQVKEKRLRFPTSEDAIGYAKEHLTSLVSREASTAGAANPIVEFEKIPEGAESYRLRATAIGNPKID